MNGHTAENALPGPFYPFYCVGIDLISPGRLVSGEPHSDGGTNRHWPLLPLINFLSPLRLVPFLSPVRRLFFSFVRSTGKRKRKKREGVLEFLLAKSHTMVNITGSFVSPSADATVTPQLLAPAGIVASILEGLTVWKLLLTLFIGAVVYDQCECS